MRRYYELREGRIVEAAGEAAPIWILISPDETERRMLVESLRLDEHTLACALDPDETPRLEFEPDHAAIILNRPRNYCREDQFMFKVASTGVFLFKDRLLVVLSEDVPVIEGGKAIPRLNGLPDVLLKIIYRSIIHFLGHLKSINAIADELEGLINTSMENRYLLNLFTLEKSLVYLTTAIRANGTLIERLRHASAKIGFSQEAIEFLDDIAIENGECAKQAEIYSNIIAGLMDARASIVNNNLNQLMKNLNMIMIAVMWPTVVCGFFAMNIKLPVEQRESLWPFVAVVCLSAGPLLALFWWIRKRSR